MNDTYFGRRELRKLHFVRRDDDDDDVDAADDDHNDGRGAQADEKSIRRYVSGARPVVST